MDALFTALVRGPSMVPTLRDGDTILVRRTERIRPGDVVVARFPGEPGLVVKRAVRTVDGGWWVEGDTGVVADATRRYGAAVDEGRALRRWCPRRTWLRRRAP